jgi:MFS family permease
MPSFLTTGAKEAKNSQSLVGRQNATKPHGLRGMLKNPYVFLTCVFVSLGCMMYGYDQGVMSPILVMENFMNKFPGLMSSTTQGWLVSALELGAWAGALFNGWLSDAISRKYSMMVAVLIFTLGTGLQSGAQSPAYFFAGRIIGGFGIGMFSMVIPLYQAEIAPPELRGSLVSLQQLSITIGTTIAFWLDFGFSYVGGTKCDPEGIANPYNTPTGAYNYEQNHSHPCTGQTDVAWRVPLALQLIPAWTCKFDFLSQPS